jgi:cation diffusion facilitator family transporter
LPTTAAHHRRQSRAQAISRTTLIGAVWNILLSIVKIIVGWLGQSQSLIADGVHSLSDLISDVLVWLAGRKANEAPDERHPYGHGRFETLATLGLGILLLVVAIGIAWDAATRLFAPESLLRPAPITLLAAALSIGIKEWLYWYTLGYAKRVRSDLLRANAWHHRSDAISSIVVLVGVAGTMAGLAYLDAIAAFIVALMIAGVAWGLGWDAIRELVDTALDTKRLDAIRHTIQEVAGVRDIHMLRTRTMGGHAAADVHVLVDPFVSVSEGHLISVMVEQRLKREIDEITDVTVHIDPEDDERAPPTMGLPLRPEALRRLNALWAGIPEAKHLKRVLLHYLDGRIEADVFLPLSDGHGPRADPEGLRDRLQQAAERDPDFKQINVYFG